MNQITVGNGIEIQVTIRNVSDVLVDPQNGVKITLTNPLGAVVVNNQTMLTSGTGLYYYDFQTTSAFVIGVYTCTVNADGISYDGIYITNRLFELVETDD